MDVLWQITEDESDDPVIGHVDRSPIGSAQFTPKCLPGGSEDYWVAYQSKTTGVSGQLDRLMTRYDAEIVADQMDKLFPQYVHFVAKRKKDRPKSSLGS